MVNPNQRLPIQSSLRSTPPLQKRHCEAKGWEATAEYVEPGNTASDDRRPSFQSMVEAALTKPPAFVRARRHGGAADCLKGGL